MSHSGSTGRVSAVLGIAGAFETLFVIFIPFAGLAACFDRPQRWAAVYLRLRATTHQLSRYTRNNPNQ
jgi:hypothetical protein